MRRRTLGRERDDVSTDAPTVEGSKADKNTDINKDRRKAKLQALAQPPADLSTEATHWRACEGGR